MVLLGDQRGRRSRRTAAPTVTRASDHSCGWVNPSQALVLIRTISTRKRAVPARIRYTATVVDGCQRRRTRHSRAAVANAASASYKGVGWTGTVVGMVPWVKVTPHGRLVGRP